MVDTVTLALSDEQIEVLADFTQSLPYGSKILWLDLEWPDPEERAILRAVFQLPDGGHITSLICCPRGKWYQLLGVSP